MVLSELGERRHLGRVGPSQTPETFTPDCKFCPVAGMSEGLGRGPLKTLLTLWEVAFQRWNMAVRGEEETLQSLVEMSAFLGAWLQFRMGRGLGTS